MEKFIIWLRFNDKKVKYNQFHVEAKTFKDALAILNSEYKNFKVLGVSSYKGESRYFENKKFY